MLCLGISFVSLWITQSGGCQKPPAIQYTTQNNLILSTFSVYIIWWLYWILDSFSSVFMKYFWHRRVHKPTNVQCVALRFSIADSNGYVIFKVLELVRRCRWMLLGKSNYQLRISFKRILGSYIGSVLPGTL